jgi:carbonic anhydrase
MKPHLHTTSPSACWLHVVVLIATLAWFPTGAPAQSPGTESTHAHAGAALKAVGLPPDQALQRLLEGNRRYVTDQARHPNQTTQRRLGLAKGQAPYAIILTCSDSRVAPELVFDQGLGDLFVIRNAGNILDDHVLGSMEYAVEHLHVELIVVVGHAKCGAVAAAVAGGEVPGHIRSLTDAIAPAVGDVKNLPGDKVDNAVRANARRVAKSLTQVEPFLKTAVTEGHLKVVAARYDLSTGKVEILE